MELEVQPLRVGKPVMVSSHIPAIENKDPPTVGQESGTNEKEMIPLKADESAKVSYSWFMVPAAAL